MNWTSRCAKLVAVIAGVAASSLGAQIASPIHQGAWIVSGTAGLTRSHVEGIFDDDRTSFWLQPTGLRFIGSHLAVGGSVSLGYNSGSGGSAFAYGVGPSARYYFTGPGPEWLPFVSATISPQWQQSKHEIVVNGVSQSVTSTMRYVAADGSLGITRMIATHVGLTGEGFVTRTQLSSRSDLPGQRQYDYGTRFGLSVFVR